MSFLEMIFNELSVRNRHKNFSTSSVHDARQWMELFIDTMREAGKHGVRTLRTSRDFSSIELVQDYPISRWLNEEDNVVDRELKRFIKSRATRAPYLQGINAIVEESGLFEHDEEYKEFHWIRTLQAQRGPRYARKSSKVRRIHLKKHVAIGLGLAQLRNTFAVSILTDQCWDNPRITCITTIMGSDSNTRRENIKIKHASRPEHINADDIWAARNAASIRNSSELLDKLEVWYPHLVFCKSAISNIQSMIISPEDFQNISRRLFDLENFAASWSVEDGFDINLIDESSDASTSVKNSDQYRSQRSFVCPYGEEEYFYYHLKKLRLKSVAKSWRIHFFPDENGTYDNYDDRKGRKILVGYIGPHLDVPSYSS